MVNELTSSMVDKTDMDHVLASEAEPGTREYIADEKLEGVVKYLSTAGVNLSLVPFLDGKTENLRNLVNQRDRLKLALRGVPEEGDAGMADADRRLRVRDTVNLVYTPRQAKAINATLCQPEVDSRTLCDFEEAVKGLKRVESNAHVPLDDRQSDIKGLKGPGYDEHHDLGVPLYDRQMGEVASKAAASAKALDLWNGATLDGVDDGSFDYTRQQRRVAPAVVKKMERIQKTTDAIAAIGMLPIVAAQQNIDLDQMSETLRATSIASMSTSDVAEEGGGGGGRYDTADAGAFAGTTESMGGSMGGSAAPMSPKGVLPSPLHGSQATSLAPLSSPGKEALGNNGNNGLGQVPTQARHAGSPRLKPLSGRSDGGGSLPGSSARDRGEREAFSSSYAGEAGESAALGPRGVIYNKTGDVDDHMSTTSGGGSSTGPASAATTTIPGGRRSFPKPPLDWSRVGYGGDAIPDYSPMYMAVEERMRSTNAAAYPTILYEPSKSPRRAVEMVSDAQAAVDKKRARFNAFKKRSDANKAITADRLEFEDYKIDMRARRRELNKAHDSIRYDADAMLLDLVRYKKQPMQRMSKKANALSTGMWAGNVVIGNNDLRRPLEERPEDRDFRTTYDAEYDTREFHADHDHHYDSFAQISAKHQTDYGVGL